MASVAALPVLIGLAVDYAIQFHARFEESSRTGLSPAEAAPAAAALGGPTIASAGLATSVGFLVLLLSPMPMVRGFGGVLVIGIALAFVVALTAGFAALVRFGAPRVAPADVPPLMPRVGAQFRRLGGHAARQGCAERRRPVVAPGRPRRQRRGGHGHRAAAHGAAGRPAARGARLGGGHADQGDLRRAPARAARTCPR